MTPRDAPVADAERLLQGGLDARGERGAGVVACQVARAAQQVGHTGLMGGGGEATVWRPPVTDQHAGIVGPEDRRRLQEPPPRLNGIDRRLRRRKGPQPLPVPIDFPAGFVGGDDGTAANGRTQRGIGRLGLPRRAVQGARDGTGRHREAEALVQKPGDLAMRQPELLVEDHHEGDGLRPELHGGGPQRVGGLQRMAALHPASTHRAAADPDSKAAYDRVHDRQLFLILRGHAGRRHGAGAVGTRRRHRNGDYLIDARRWRSVTVAPMPGPASAPAAPRRRRRRALREGGGLAFACPTRQVEFVLQPVVLAAQPVALALQPGTLVFQPGTLAFCPLQVSPQPIVSSFKLTDGVGSIRHIEVMPDSAKLYKSRMFGMEGQTR